MDLVALIIAIEEFLGIEFPDDASLQCNTVGELYQWLLSQQPRHIDPIRADRVDEIALERLTPALAKVLDRRESELDGSTDLRKLIPFYDRRRVWDELHRELRLYLPSLNIPRWLLHRLVAGSVTVGLCLFPSIGSHGLVLATSMLLVGFVCLLPLAVTIQPQHATVLGLATTIARKNFARLTASGEPYTAAELWAILVNIISKELRLPDDEILPSTRWIEDLRCEA